MLDRSDTGCEVCKKIPVLEKEDMEWFSSGQPLSSLVAEAIANINGGGAVSMTNTSPEGAMDSVSNTMDELEALFGFSLVQSAFIDWNPPIARGITTPSAPPQTITSS